MTYQSGPLSLTWDGHGLQFGFAVPRERLLEAGFWVAAIVLAGGQAWASRNFPSTVDLVSYLDIADAYTRGDWANAINAYWNPLYSWLLAAMFAVLRPSPEFEYPVAKLLDFAIFVACLWCFGWFLAQVRRAYRTAVSGSPDTIAIPDWAWVVGGYSMFLWSSLRWITVTSNTPDMACAALAYLTWGLLLRLERQPRLRDCALLGVALACGYFARTPMFVIGAVMLAMAWLAGDRTARRGYLAATLVFLLLTSPFVLLISRARGHLTIGDNGRLNHAWLANPGAYIIPNRHWQGGPAGYGTPIHPSRMLWDTPPAFEFATPLGGVYPPWTDPSYWYEGLAYHFDAKAEALSLWHNLVFYFWLFGRWMLPVLVASLAVLDLRETWTSLRRTAHYWMPAVAGLLLYLVANDLLEQWRRTPQPPTRYVAIFIVLFTGMLAFALRVRAGAMTPLRARIAAAALAVFVLGMGASLVREEVWMLSRPEPTTPFQIATALRTLGIQPGMRVAIIGPSSDHEFWARLAGVRIIADVPNEVSFWAKDPAMRASVVEVLAHTGAQAVVAPFVPRLAAGPEWHHLEGYNYAVQWLKP